MLASFMSCGTPPSLQQRQNISYSSLVMISSHHLLVIEGEDMEAVTDFTFLGSMITADGDSSHKIKRCLLLGKKVRTNLDSILKSRDITLPTKVCMVKAMVFPVVMYGSESWSVKKSDH